MTKGELRTKLLRLLRQQKEEARRRKSEAIRQQVTRLPEFQQASTVCCYVALPYEVQTWRLIDEMLAQGKRVVVPVTRQRSQRLTLSEVRDWRAELAPGSFGVHEPVPSAVRRIRRQALDLVLVPGLAFDHRGHRLGHGHGYFDRFLARLPRRVTTIGLAYRFQLVDHLPVAPHDHPVDRVVTA